MVPEVDRIQSSSCCAGKWGLMRQRELDRLTAPEELIVPLPKVQFQPAPLFLCHRPIRHAPVNSFAPVLLSCRNFNKLSGTGLDHGAHAGDRWNLAFTLSTNLPPGVSNGEDHLRVDRLAFSDVHRDTAHCR